MRAAALAAVLAIAAVQPLAAAGRPIPGLYGNVGSDGVTGDIGGFEIAIHEGPRPWGEFVQCEGDCSVIEHVRLRRIPDGYTFDHVERRTEEDGRDGKAVTHVTLRRSGASRLIEGRGDFPFTRERLRPLTRRVGLAIAKDYR